MSVDTAYRVSPLHRSDRARLGPYSLVGRLGSGGMGVVYLALDPNDRYVAIKLVHAELAENPEFRARFRSEVERARQVPAYCTAEVLDADQDHSPPYLVVEYVDGPSLAQVVEERGPLAASHLHSVAVGVATALTGIHGAGVIHRDLKPENVLLAPGSPKVIDFGIARAFEATSQLTRADQWVGTVAYMAPERFAADSEEPVTAAADVFAWGCVVGYAGTGKTPFHADSPAATAARILTQPPRLGDLEEPLRGLVEEALAKNPEDRPSARELLDRLVAARDMRELAVTPVSPASATGPVERARVTMDGVPAGTGQPAWAAPVASPRPIVRRRSHRQRRDARWLAMLAALLVVAGIGTVLAVLDPTRRAGLETPSPGDRRGGAGVVQPQPTTTRPGGPNPPALAPPTQVGRPATVGPAPAPTDPPDSEIVISDSLAQPGRWRNTSRLVENTECRVDGVLRVTRVLGLGQFACPGPQTVIDDAFSVAVSVTLQSAASCGAIWFHFDDDDGGEMMRICARGFELTADRPGDRAVLGRLSLSQSLPIRQPVRIRLAVADGRIDVWRSNEHVGNLPLPGDGPEEGQVLLGISVPSLSLSGPYVVDYSQIVIRES